MTTETTLWHQETVRDITRLAIIKVSDMAEGVSERALRRLDAFGTLYDFVRELTVLHLRHYHQTGDQLDGKGIRQLWIQWSSSEEAIHAQWFTPLTRVVSPKLDYTATVYVAQAAQDLLAHAEINAHLEAHATTLGAYATPEHVLQHG